MNDRHRNPIDSHDDSPGDRSMEAQFHVRAGFFARVRAGLQAPGSLHRMYLEHLLELCPRTRRAWELLDVETRGTIHRRLDGLSALAGDAEDPAPDPDDLSLRTPSIEVLEQQVAARRRHRTLVRDTLRRLLELPREKRLRKVQRSPKRFRSRMMVEQLMVECRRRVRNDPPEAESLAALVPHVIERIPGDATEPWRLELAALAVALRANAVRVAGDLPRADRLFATVHHDLAAVAVHDLAVRGEIASLEGSLRIDQRATAEAAEHLDLAALFYSLAGERQGVARVRIQQGNLCQTAGDPESALRWLEDAARHLDADAADAEYLYLCTVTGRVNALCDLRRYREAAELLDGHRATFAIPDDRHQHAILQLLRGQVALGLEEPREALRHLAASRDDFLRAGRNYDGAIAGLYQAEALRAAGEWEELEELARELLRLFRGVDVDREATACLALLARAARAREVDRELVQSLVQRIAALHPSASTGVSLPIR